jgi:hypothetical protein
VIYRSIDPGGAERGPRCVGRRCGSAQRALSGTAGVPIQTDTELRLSASSTRFVFRKHLHAHASDDDDVDDDVDDDEDDDDEGGRGGRQSSLLRRRRSEARG